MRDTDMKQRIVDALRSGEMLVLGDRGLKRDVESSILREVLGDSSIEAHYAGLRIAGARFINFSNLRHLDIGYPLHLEFCDFTEELDLSGSVLRELSLRSSTIPNLNLERTDVHNGIFAPNASIHERLVVSYANVGRQLNLQGADIGQSLKLEQLQHDSVAILLDGLNISGSLFADRVKVRGKFSASDLVIQGQLNLNRSELRNPDGGSLDISGSQVSRIFLSDSRLEGDLSFAMTEIKTLDLTRARAVSSSVREFRLWSCKIGWLRMSLDESWSGLDFRDVAIGDLVVRDGVLLPNLKHGSGWHIDHITGALGRDPALAIRWLERSSLESTQPWEAVACAFQDAGLTSESSRIRLSGARRVTRLAPMSRKVPRFLYFLLAGYGYRPGFSAVWLAVALLFMCVLITQNPQAIVPTDGPRAEKAFHSNVSLGVTGPPFSGISAATPCVQYEPYPCFDVITFTATNSIPGVGSVAKQDWTLGSEAVVVTIVFVLLKLVVWILSAFMVAGWVGLLKKG